MTSAAHAHTVLPIEETRAVYPYRWLLLAVLLTGTFMLVADFSIVNVALPSIRDGLGATGGQQQLIIAFYAITYSVLLIPGGRLGDLVGRKRMFIGGLFGFIAASSACGFAPTIWLLVGARLVQGMAAAMMAPQVLSVIRVVFPPEERSRALGAYGATVGLGLVLGQLIGGVLIGLHPFGLQWEAIFLVNVPVGLIDLALAAWLMPRDERLRGAHLDIPGAIVLSAGLLLIVYPLVAGREAGWPTWAFICLGLAVPVLAVFIRLEQRTTRRGGTPLLDIGLFSKRAFSVGLLLCFMVYATSSFYFACALYLQNGQHWGVMAAGFGMLPIGAAFFFGSLLAPWLVARFDNAAALLGYGVTILGYCGLIVVLLLGQGPGVAFFAATAVAGLGLGTILPALIRIVLADVPPEQAGMVSGVLSTAIQIGPAIAIPVIGGVFFTVLGVGPDGLAYQHALAAIGACLVLTYLVCAGLVALL